MTKKTKKVDVGTGDATRRPPMETGELRKSIESFFRTVQYPDSNGVDRQVGGYKWGVYAFYDYDKEPIYVGQTKEKLSGRVRRHMTNQRTDAVAMSVLDPFEVAEIEVWPLPQFEGINSKHPDYKKTRDYLDALEHLVFTRLRKESRFKAILNEKDPPTPKVTVIEPETRRRTIIADQVRALREHPDTRLARRALIVSKLAQVISERELKHNGLRRVLLTQAKRLQWLAERRFVSLGGDAAVEAGPENDDEFSGREA
ncbi:GIY-YIG nuclease family protein [Mesorhizobium caraganae]|uniref:GIY-YIG nuclease family protein n=1 Tax=Mesorhizobium caraganae TaxID=483206 RepID=UPI00178179B3|nr:GIY-YIG nuclease family protein [Mesorhizobium caraganae]